MRTIQQPPENILLKIYERASAKLEETLIADPQIRDDVDYVCRCISNRAGVRLLMACLLGKLHNPNVDPRKPYKEIKDKDCFSGRKYDERYLTDFISKHSLPVNQTTAFLTPTLRNINHTLTIDSDLVGRPRDLYKKTLQLLAEVAENRIPADILLIETVRVLLRLRDEKKARMISLLSALESASGSLPLSCEALITLIDQHLACKNASRLPVLIVATAYKVAGVLLAERVLPLNTHNAADKQTGSVGDIEICLIGDDSIVTAYEMKMKRVTTTDIDFAVTKILKSSNKIENYLFITTEAIDPYVSEYAATFYEHTEGTEIAVLDCVSFLRHFLHLFHRVREDYLNTYQDMVLAEPDSAISQTLKEAFLALRQAAESGE